MINRKLLFMLISIVSLFISFQFNFFQVANMQWFKHYQYDSEALVIGKLAESDRNGILSHHGLLGFVSINNLKYGESGFLEGSTDAYLNENITFVYRPYSSQFGIQGFFFGYADKLLTLFSISQEDKLFIFHLFTSLFLAVVLTGILYVFYLEFGLISASVTLTGILSSEWLVIFGKNLYWMSALWFLPVLVVLGFLNKLKYDKAISWKLLYLFVYLSICLKSLNGYEYISTVLLASVIPIVYYALVLGWTLKEYFLKTLYIGLSGLFGFFTAVFMHILQLSFEYGNISKGIAILTQRIAVRTFANPDVMVHPVMLASAKADILDVLEKYFLGHFFHGTLHFYIFFIILLISTLLGILISNYGKFLEEVQRNFIALALTTWLSFLAPVSWYVLAKSHSYIHTHINFVLWYTPSMIFGFLLIGYVLSMIINYFITSKGDTH